MSEDEPMNKELQKHKIEEKLKKNDIQPDTIDTEALIDSDSRYPENLKTLEKELNVKLIPDEERDKEEYKGQQREHNKEMVREEKQELQRKQKESIRKIAENENTDLKEHYQHLTDYVELIAEEQLNALIVLSEAGLGKSFHTLTTLYDKGLEVNNDCELINTYSTPLSLYRTLYENRKKVLVFDDVEGILDNKKAVSMLKSALWTTSNNGEREVQYRSSKLPSDLPSKFSFEGGIIFLVNELNMKGENMEALKNRCLYHELNFSHKEKFEIMTKIANKDLEKGLCREERLEVLRFIQEVVGKSHRLNLRSYMKALDIYGSGKENWRGLVEKQLEYEKDSDLDVLKEILEKGYDKVGREVKEFKERTGKCRSTYYNYRTKLEERGEV